jgi:hypothetical protein
MPTTVHYPTAWVNLYLLLEDLQQPGAGELVTLSGTPLELRVEKNSPQEADTIEVTVDLEDFPFDPRVLRAATIEAFVADAGSSDANFWRVKKPDEMRPYAVFAGVVDEPESTFDDEHRTFRLKGRDYTAYFLDAEMEPGDISYIREGKKLSFAQVLRELLDQREATQAIEIDDRDGLAAKLFPADYKVRSGEGKKGARQSRDGETIWDVVQELALEAGVIVYVELDKVVVREPATIFGSEIDEERLLTWTLGGDVLSLVQTRSLGRQHGINVLVTSYDPDAKKTLRALSPEDAGQEEKEEIAVSGVADAGRAVKSKKRAQVRPFVVRGIREQSQLQRIADQIREQLRHHELEGVLTTVAMVDSRGKPATDFTYGDPVILQLSDTVQGIGFKPVEAQIQDLVAKGYPQQAAQGLALALDRFKVPFYLHRASYRFSTSSGFELEVEFRSRKQVELA